PRVAEHGYHNRREPAATLLEEHYGRPTASLRSPHPYRRRHADGRADATILGARADVVRGRRRWRPGPRQAARRKPHRLPHDLGQGRRDGSALPPQGGLAVLWPQ